MEALAKIVARGKRIAAAESPESKKAIARRLQPARKLNASVLRRMEALARDLEPLAARRGPGSAAERLLAAMRDARVELGETSFPKGTTRKDSKRYLVAAVEALALDHGLSPRETEARLHEVLEEALGQSGDEWTLLSRARQRRRGMEAKLLILGKVWGHEPRLLAPDEKPNGEGSFLLPLPAEPRLRRRAEKERELVLSLVKQHEENGEFARFAREITRGPA